MVERNAKTEAERIAEHEKHESTITRQTNVQLGLMASLLVTAIAGTWYAATWTVKLDGVLDAINNRLQTIEVTMASLKTDGWDYTDMKRWTRRLQEANPSLVVPEPWND